MGIKYTKDALIDAIIENQKNTSQFMERLNITLEKLNDNNLLHKQAIDINTTATKEMTTAIKMQSTYQKVQNQYVKWITVTFALALVVLAGAEKVLKFLPTFK